MEDMPGKLLVLGYPSNLVQVVAIKRPCPRKILRAARAEKKRAKRGSRPVALIPPGTSSGARVTYPCVDPIVFCGCSTLSQNPWLTVSLSTHECIIFMLYRYLKHYWDSAFNFTAEALFSHTSSVFFSGDLIYT